MKILNFLLILILALTAYKINEAQQLYWKKIGNFSYVNDVKINSAGYIFACRQESNGIRRSVDDGESWEFLNIPNSMIGNLAITRTDQIFASDINRSNNSIYTSHDGGNTWTECSITGGNIRSLFVSREGYIYAGNLTGRFFKSTDEGLTWSSDSITNKQINCIGSCSNGQIFVGTEGAGIYSSTDFGESWFQVNSSPVDIYSIVIKENDYIFATSFENVLISEDYGISWNPANIFFYSRCVLGIDSANSIFVSRSGIRKTTDNGQTWIDLGGPDNITRIEPSLNKIYLAASSGVYRYDPNVPPPNLLGSEFLPFHTGNKWQYMEDESNSNGNSYSLQVVSVLSDTLINNLSYFRLSSYNDLLRYSKSERKIYLRWNDSDYVYVDFNVPLDNVYQAFGPWHYYGNAVALGGEQQIFNRDLVYGGLEFDSGTSLTDVVFTDSIGITSKHVGLSWGPVYSYEDDLLEAIIYDSTGISEFITNHFKPEFDLIPLTEIDTVLFHLNFEIHHNYTRLNSMWNAGVDFIDSVKMFSYYSKDDSIISVPVIIPSHTANPVNYNYTVNKQLNTTLLRNGFTFNYRFTAKDKGLIPEYTNNPDSGYYHCVWQDPSGVNQRSYLRVFALSQNYPNPFNPTTKIKIQLPESGRVTLIVYDVLGRKISTLVNEEKPAGSYEVNFNAPNLPTGVYFYRIEAGKYSDTKKLMLLK